MTNPGRHFKDAVLDSIADIGNVAQFVSFTPDGEQRFSRVSGHQPNQDFGSIELAVEALFRSSTDRSINVRSFDPTSPKSREFVYGLTSTSEAVAAISRLGASGLYTIANETIDIRDGGVSGVALGEMIEFSPEDTPRCVERPGNASLPRDIGEKLLRTVYGFSVELPDNRNVRTEFSIHPIRRGVRGTHTILWELEEFDKTNITAVARWPNNFSRFIGDKAFGLLMAHLIGLPVPYTTVFGRKVAPFSFGKRSKTSEPWIRTCPAVQMPGKFTTKRGWLDPFELMQAEDPSGTEIAAVLAQEGIDAAYSGAAITAADGNVLVEGTTGFGDEFMVGRKLRTNLPPAIIRRVRRLYARARAKLGPVRVEWVVDTHRAWIVQLHTGASVSVGNVIVPGEPSKYLSFDVTQGLEALRTLIDEVSSKNVGIELVGDVGITSHFGDLLRRADVPSVVKYD